MLLFLFNNWFSPQPWLEILAFHCTHKHYLCCCNNVTLWNQVAWRSIYIFKFCIWDCVGLHFQVMKTCMNSRFRICILVFVSYIPPPWDILLLDLPPLVKCTDILLLLAVVILAIGFHCLLVVKKKKRIRVFMQQLKTCVQQFIYSSILEWDRKYMKNDSVTYLNSISDGVLVKVLEWRLIKKMVTRIA